LAKFVVIFLVLSCWFRFLTFILVAKDINSYDADSCFEVFCLSESIDKMPEMVKKDLIDLRAALDHDLPPKIPDSNVLIATWNLRMFGNITESWVGKPYDSPVRNWHAIACIKEIVSRFDVIAIQEVRSNLRGLRHLLKMLGGNWSFLMTDVTKGSDGNFERMAFLFDTRKVGLSGLACELVVPPEQLASIAPDALTRQFARTPYAVSFWSGGRTFILVTLHVKYGQPKERIPELKAIAAWMSDWAKDINSWDHNLITLGDFNIDRQNDDMYKAFMSTNLHVPEDLMGVPRSIFDKPNKKHFYDQIAWFDKGANVPSLSLKYKSSGYFDFTQTAMNTLNLTKQELSFRISDHFPLYAEFDPR
jgi:endonuclease/exonuclease/phosphatase family metal-dependent hydrolase